MTCYIGRGERNGNDGKHWNERLVVVWGSREERWVTMWTIGKAREDFLDCDRVVNGVLDGFSYDGVINM